MVELTPELIHTNFIACLIISGISFLSILSFILWPSKYKNRASAFVFFFGLAGFLFGTGLAIAYYLLLPH